MLNGLFFHFFATFWEKSAKTNLQRRSDTMGIVLWKISTVQFKKESKEAQCLLFKGTKAAPYAEDVRSDVKKANLTFPAGNDVTRSSSSH
jgi:hypothetical protein